MLWTLSCKWNSDVVFRPCGFWRVSSGRPCHLLYSHTAVREADRSRRSFRSAWIPWNSSFRYILFHEKRLQTVLWHHNARVNSHQRWKQMRFRVCFHLWCELTSTINVPEWQVSWNSWYKTKAKFQFRFLYTFEWCFRICQKECGRIFNQIFVLSYFVSKRRSWLIRHLKVCVKHRTSNHKVNSQSQSKPNKASLSWVILQKHWVPTSHQIEMLLSLKKTLYVYVHSTTKETHH